MFLMSSPKNNRTHTEFIVAISWSITKIGSVPASLQHRMRWILVDLIVFLWPDSVIIIELILSSWLVLYIEAITIIEAVPASLQRSMRWILLKGIVINTPTTTRYGLDNTKKPIPPETGF